MSPASNHADMDWSHALPDFYHSGGALQDPHSAAEHNLSLATSHDSLHSTTPTGPFRDLLSQDAEHFLFIQHGQYGRQTEPMFDFGPNVLTGVTTGLDVVVDQHDQDFTSSDDINHTFGDVGQVGEWNHG
jgi:hypothetical protein